jgi:alpha-mannosidase
MTKRKTIHIISQAHLDLAWMWSWRESWSEALNNITSVVRLMDKYHDLTFSYSNAIVYKWLEKSDPWLFGKVRELVEEGRWEIVGGWFVESDCNIPSAESLLKQGLHGKKYFKEKFGVDVKIGYCPDAFGHCAELPAILKKTGFSHYVFSKPRLGDEFPHYFRWRDSDGSEIFTWRIHGGYATGPMDTPETLKNSLRDAAKHNFPPNCLDTAFFLGLGDHGGGPSEEQILTIRELREEPGMPELVFSSLAGLFDAASDSIPPENTPLFQGEIQKHNIGCYSANGRIKKLNRQTENLLLAAEKISAAAENEANIEIPREKLDEAWEKLLFNQFHDIIAGTCIPACYDDAEESLGAARHTAKVIITEYLHCMARRVDTSSVKYNALFVYNTLPFARHCLIDLDMFTAIDGNHGPKITSLFDSKSGEIVPVQFVMADCPFGPWNRPWEKLLALVKVPPDGWLSLETRSNSADKFDSCSTPEVDITGSSAKLAYSSLHDTRGKEWLSGNGIYLTEFEDTSDTFGHDVISFLNNSEKFADLAESSVVETGPVRWSKRLTGFLGHSSLELVAMTFSECGFLELIVSGDWREKNKVLKLGITTALEDASVIYQTQL